MIIALQREDSLRPVFEKNCELLNARSLLVGGGRGDVLVQDGDAEEVLDDEHDGPS